MPTLSSAGIGSGLDVNAIVSQLMAVERQPLNTLDSKARALDSKISAFGTIKSQLTALADAAAKLALPATWTARAVASSNGAAVGAAVSPSATASPTSFSIEVKQLARAQSVASSAIASGSALSSGSLSIQLGTWDNTATSPTFNPGDAPARSIEVASGDTLAIVAAKINSADAGVTATILKDSTGERLLLRSASTGEASGFRIQAQDDGTGSSGVGLAALAFDDPVGGGMAANPIQYAQDARATINGIGVSSPSNSLTDTVPGISLTLSQVTSAPVEITASIDTTSMRSAVEGFVKAYNAMNQTLNAATKFDAGTRTAALLQGDSTTVGLQSALRRMVGSASDGGVFQRLSDVGVSIAKNGAGDLAIDGTRVDAALKTPDAIKRFFTTDTIGGDVGTGFAVRFSTFTKAAIGGDGAITGKTASLQSQKTSIGKDQDRLGERLTLTEQRLRKQYTSLDTTVSSLTALNNYISQQVAQWNRSNI